MTLKTNNLQPGTCNSGMESMSCEVLLPRGFLAEIGLESDFQGARGWKIL
jgi:hypothetical protein